jgi:hypothetical protein
MSEVKKAWFIYNEEAEEGIVLCDISDAVFAAKGRQVNIGVSCVADHWRELYADDESDIEFPMIEGSIIDGVFIKD